MLNITCVHSQQFKNDRIQLFHNSVHWIDYVKLIMFEIINQFQQSSAVLRIGRHARNTSIEVAAFENGDLRFEWGVENERMYLNEFAFERY